MADPKLGVYICSDCGIGEALDTEKLENVAKNQYRVENRQDRAVPLQPGRRAGDQGRHQ